LLEAFARMIYMCIWINIYVHEYTYVYEYTRVYKTKVHEYIYVYENSCIYEYQDTYWYTFDTEPTKAMP